MAVHMAQDMALDSDVEMKMDTPAQTKVRIESHHTSRQTVSRAQKNTLYNNHHRRP